MIRTLTLFAMLFATAAASAQIRFETASARNLATSVAVPAASTVVQPPNDIVDQLRSGTVHTIAVPSPLGPWVIEAQRFEVLSLDAQVLAATPTGDRHIAVPAHAMPMGRLQGASDSRVFLAAFDTHVTGIIEIDQPGGLRRFVIAPDTVIEGRMAASIIHEVALHTENGERCTTNELPDYQRRADSIMASYEEQTRIEKSTGRGQSATVHALQLALECDSTYFTKHQSSLAFSAQYALTLAGACSAIYQRDANVILQIPFLRIWTYTDPYVGTINERLGNIRTYWNANMQHVNRAVTCLLSGSGGGGLAWVGVLCNGFGYNVSGVNGQVNFPADGYIWDVNVTAHELGHNIGSPHSHNCGWNPPLDSCWYAEGGCYDHTLPQRGSIMSYCHLQYTGNAMRFHPRVASLFNRVMENNPCVVEYAPAAHDTDVAVVDITVVPTGGVLLPDAGFRPTAVLRNQGKSDAGEVMVSYRITNNNNDTLITGEQMVSIVSGDVITVTFDEISLSEAGDYLVEVTQATARDQHSRNDRLTRPFQIGEAPTAFITLEMPNGGETFTAGAMEGIRFNATGVQQINTEYSTDGGVTWLTVRARTSANVVGVQWEIPPTPTDQALVRLISLEDGNVMDISDAPFTIVLPRDVMAVDILEPTVNGTSSTPLTPRVLVRNTGAEDLSNVIVRLTLRWVRMNDLQYDQLDTIASLAAGAEVEVPFPASTLLPEGVHIMDLSVAVDGDMNAENDHFTRQFTATGIAPPHSTRIEHGPQRVILRWDPSGLNPGDLVELWRGTSSADMQRIRSFRTTVNTWMDAPLSDGVTYTYALRTRRGSDTSVFTDLRAATPTTYPKGAEPWTPQIIGPRDGATDVPFPHDLVWSSAPGGDRYVVQLSANESFSDIRYVYVTHNDDAIPSPAGPGETWFWRVRAINESYNGDWSQPASFTTTDLCAGNALRFNGTDAKAFNNSAQWNGGPVTVEWWQYTATADRKNSSVFSFGASDNNRNRLQAHCPWGNGRIYWDYGAIGDSGRLQAVYPAYDQWVHIALVSDGETFMRIYTNGELAAERSGAMEATALQGLVIGAQHESNWFKGGIDEFRVWTVARTQEQIRRAMRLPEPPATDRDGLYLMYRMDEGDGSRSADASGRGLDLSLLPNVAWIPSEAGVNCVAPEELAVVAVTNPGTVPAGTVHSYSFSWAPVEGAEWYEIEVYPTEQIDGSWLHRARNVARTEVTFRGLPASQTCAWRVRAMSTSGTGPWSTARIVTPDPCESDVIVFSGNNDHVVSDDFVFNGRATTVEYWAHVQTADVGNRSSFVIGEEDDADRRFQSHAPWRNNTWFFDHGDYRNGGRIEAAYDNALNRWAHIAMASNGIDEMQLFIDGNLAATSSFASTPGELLTATIGANAPGGYRFKGRMSDFRVWNTQRSAEQIREGMYERIVGGRSHLLANWPLDDGEGTTAQDIGTARWDAKAGDGIPSTWEPDSMRVMMQVPPSLRGPYIAIKGDTVTYSLHTDRSEVVNFRVRNGIIIDRPDQRTVRVQWVDNTSQGEICVLRTFPGGCQDSMCFDIPLRDPVSVDEDLQQGALASIAPNPAGHTTTVRWAFPATTIEVRDVMGRLVVQQTDVTNIDRLDLDAADWASGSYLVRVIGAHRVVTLPLVVQR